MATAAKRRRGRRTLTQARAARRARRDRKKRWLKLGGLSAIGLMAFIFIASLFAPTLSPFIGGPGGGDAGERIEDIGGGNMHIGREESHDPYNSVPATSGWHYSDAGAPRRWGVHDEVLPDEVLVHNLEHAGVGIHYNCPEGCDDLITQLAEITRDSPKVIMSPYPDMDSTIALTAWNYLDKLDAFDETRILLFIEDHVNSRNAPEPFAR